MYKSDAVEFRNFLASLSKESWLGKPRSWWPRYLFHHSHIENIVKILSDGRLLSRAMMKSSPLNFTDSASPDIIDHTDDRWKSYVRFYFRPRTPTLYHSEGFRPKHSQQLKAHCPVPVYLLFDSAALLSLEGTNFSSGSLARADHQIFTTAIDFKNLPFKLIYHDSAFTPLEKDTIIKHRQAEVVVPDSVGLEHLKYVWCRSQAEFEMLRHLLGEELWKKWSPIARTALSQNLYFDNWIYADTVYLNSHRVKITFNPCRKIDDAGPFDIKVILSNLDTGTIHTWRGEETYLRPHVPNTVEINLAESGFPVYYKIELTIDDQLAYATAYKAQEDELPF